MHLTGDGLCAEIAPKVFIMQDDGLAYVQDEDGIKNPGGASHLANVPVDEEPGVVEAMEECPGECIFITD